jgi:uncharacterized protein
LRSCRLSREKILSLSVYDVASTTFTRGLKALAHVLTKAEANAGERKFDPAVLLNARLAPDMFALTRQVQIATDHVKGAMSRLAGREVPRWEDNEASFAELQARIAKALDHVASFSEADLEGSETRAFEMKTGPTVRSFVGGPYLLTYAIPNFYFHLTTAYAILRENGVPIGKRDFLAG